MSWLGTDLHLLEADAEQLRLHLTWLLEDLHTHHAGTGGQEDARCALVGEVAACLRRLQRLDALLGQVRQAVGQTMPQPGS